MLLRGRERGRCGNDFYSRLKSNTSIIPDFGKGCSKLINNTVSKVTI